MVRIRQRLVVLVLAVEVTGAAGIVSALTVHERKDLPATMSSQAAESKTPFAVVDAGAEVNFVVRDTGPVHLFWRNGNAPFRVLFDLDGRRQDITLTSTHHLAFEIPESARKRFAVIIRDQDGQQNKVFFRLRDRDPLAQGATEMRASGKFRLDQAQQLSRHQHGMWYLHSLSSLLNAGDTGAAASLATAISGTDTDGGPTLPTR
jgi:hypothetical protein